MNEPGSVLTYLKQELQRPGHNLTSPCIQIPRIRFGALPHASDTKQRPQGRQGAWNASTFLTLAWRNHAAADNYPINRISKVMVDLSRISWNELAPVESIHMPIQQGICKRRRLHIRTNQQVFVLHHYLGTWEQYTYRDDSRAGNERSALVSTGVAVLMMFSFRLPSDTNQTLLIGSLAFRCMKRQRVIIKEMMMPLSLGSTVLFRIMATRQPSLC